MDLVGNIPSDGNCLFSSVSVHLFGKPEFSMLVKVIFGLKVVKVLDQFVRQVSFNLRELTVCKAH